MLVYSKLRKNIPFYVSKLLKYTTITIIFNYNVVYLLHEIRFL